MMNIDVKADKRRISVLFTGPGQQKNGLTGGISTHVRNFLKAFLQSDDIHIVAVTTTQGLHQQENWSKKVLRAPSVVVSFYRKSKQASLVHINSTFDNRSVIRDGVLLFISGVLMRKPTILQFHGGDPERVLLYRGILARSLFKKLYGVAPHVLVLSKVQENALKSRVSLESLMRVRNYIDISGNPCEKTFDGSMRFLFMSRIDKDKGIESIVDAADLVVRGGLDILVEFCGKGPAEGWLKREIKKRGLSKWLRYRGFVDGREKEKILARSHVLLLPTRHAEGLPYSVLEAFSYSMPVITCRQGALSEMIKNGVNGRIIDYGDVTGLVNAMCDYCSDHQKLRQEGGEGRRLVDEGHTLNHLVADFAALYTSLV